MPRKARNLYPLVAYHVMVQGINKSYIFSEEKYKKKYIYLMKENLDKFNIKLISYCIMNNHAHLLLYNENQQDVSNAMHMINSVFSMYYNKKLNRVGYVFRDRFLSQQIYDYNQLKVCIAYIHNNPVKAKIVQNPEDYLYSSCKDYKKGSSLFVDFDLISRLFKDNSINDIWKYCDDSKFALKEPNFFDKEKYELEIVSFIDKYEITKDVIALKKFLEISKNEYYVPNTEIAKILNVNNQTIGNWIKKLNIDIKN